MPRYELALVLKRMSKTESAVVLKRTLESIFDKGGIVRKLENLGFRALPHKISEHGVVHKEGGFFTLEFDTAPIKISDLNEELGRDIDIVRRHIFKVGEPIENMCKIGEELQPPAYRNYVQKMITANKRKQKKKYDYNSGLDYYPFQK